MAWKKPATALTERSTPQEVMYYLLCLHSDLTAAFILGLFQISLGSLEIKQTHFESTIEFVKRVEQALGLAMRPWAHGWGEVYAANFKGGM